MFLNAPSFHTFQLWLAVDIWAAGTILLFFLSGKFPLFHSSDDVEALMEIAAIIGKRKMESVATLHSMWFRLRSCGGLPLRWTIQVGRLRQMSRTSLRTVSHGGNLSRGKIPISIHRLNQTHDSALTLCHRTQLIRESIPHHQLCPPSTRLAVIHVRLLHTRIHSLRRIRLLNPITPTSNWRSTCWNNSCSQSRRGELHRVEHCITPSWIMIPKMMSSFRIPSEKVFVGKVILLTR
jgi:hypothetical protein